MNEKLEEAKKDYMVCLAQKIESLSWDAGGNLGSIEDILNMTLLQIHISLLQNGIGLCVVSNLMSDKGNDKSARAAIGKIYTIVHILKKRNEKENG